MSQRWQCSCMHNSCTLLWLFNARQCYNDDKISIEPYKSEIPLIQGIAKSGIAITLVIIQLLHLEYNYNAGESATFLLKFLQYQRFYCPWDPQTSLMSHNLLLSKLIARYYNSMNIISISMKLQYLHCYKNLLEICVDFMLWNIKIYVPIQIRRRGQKCIIWW